MRAVVQRVRKAQVVVDGVCVAQIQQGLLVLVGIAPADTVDDADRLLNKLLACRIFPASDGRMSLSVADIAGGVLLVPNFTLMADLSRGNRPSFTPAASPELASELFAQLCALARERYASVACGTFGADMQVSLVNDGPVTLVLEI